VPDPQQLADIIDVSVTVAEAATAGASFAICMIASTFAIPAQWALDGWNRQKLYRGDLSSVLEAMEDDGFAVDGTAYRMARAAFRQTPSPNSIVVGRRDAADAGWSAALTAIRTSNSDWYAFAIEDRDDTSVAAASAWAETRFVRYFAQNETAAVLAATAGNVLQDLQDLEVRRTVYLYHDPSTASALAPAVIRTSTAGPWDVSDVLGGYLNPEIDGTETSVLLSGAPGSALGKAGPYALTDAWHLDLSIGGVAQPIVTFLTAQFVSIAAATAAEIGAVIVAAIGASKIQAGDAAALGLGAAGMLAIRTVKEGTGQNFAILIGSTAGLVTELAGTMTVAVKTGTGDMADSTAMTAAEVATWLNGEPVAGATAAAGVGAWVDYAEIETDSTGEYATARVRGALVNDVLGFPRELTKGIGNDEDYAEVQWMAARVGGAKLDSPRPQGLVTLDNFRPFNDGRMKADVLTDGQRLNVRAQGGNTFELRTAGRRPGEFHFGKAPSGHYVDSLIAADWLTLRILEAIKSGLDTVADAGSQIDFSDVAARVFLLAAIGGVLARAVASGILADADVTPPDESVGKVTGLVIPTLAELEAGGPTLERFWSGITFTQQGGRALQGAIVRGTVLP
jgi:hypothetical protein